MCVNKIGFFIPYKIELNKQPIRVYNKNKQIALYICIRRDIPIYETLKIHETLEHVSLI